MNVIGGVTCDSFNDDKRMRCVLLNGGLEEGLEEYTLVEYRSR